eukprot:4909089-Pleurochrysis_carterae.AAC.1
MTTAARPIACRAMAVAYSPHASVTYMCGGRTFCDVGVQTDPSLSQPSADALRMRRCRKLKKAQEESDMRARCKFTQSETFCQPQHQPSGPKPAQREVCFTDSNPP